MLLWIVLDNKYWIQFLTGRDKEKFVRYLIV